MFYFYISYYLATDGMVMGYSWWYDHREVAVKMRDPFDKFFLPEKIVEMQREKKFNLGGVVCKDLRQCKQVG